MNSWLSKLELMLPSDEITSCRVAMRSCVNQGRLTLCFTYQYLKSGSVTTAAICCVNHPVRGLWFDFSWSLAKQMQVMHKFASKVLTSYKFICRPLMKESIVLGLECSTFCPRCSSLCELENLVFMLTHIL